MHPGSLVEEHDHVDEKVAAAPPLAGVVVGAASVEVPAASLQGPQQAEESAGGRMGMGACRDRG